MADPLSKDTAPKLKAHINGKKIWASHEWECSYTPKAATRRIPMASPPFFWVRKAEGKEKKTSAAADATDNVEKVIAW